ncbi:hypothetical protein ACFW82_06035, partial [Streptomyces sp. NPDC058728]
MASPVTLLRDMHYPTPLELVLTARALADDHPGQVRLRQAGSSRAGQPLWVLSVGPADGPGGGPAGRAPPPPPPPTEVGAPAPPPQTPTRAAPPNPTPH